MGISVHFVDLDTLEMKVKRNNDSMRGVCQRSKICRIL